MEQLYASWLVALLYTPRVNLEAMLDWLRRVYSMQSKSV